MKAIQIHDSLSRSKQLLLADDQRDLSIYFCGPTVYDHIHVGNARTYAVFMAFTRYLRFAGINVRIVSNITDINDKIYTAAAQRNMKSADLANLAHNWYVEDTNRLGLGRPDAEPKASDHVQGMIGLIGELIERDLAYEAEGSVYFRVERYKEYGELSGRSIEKLLSGSREGLEGGAGKEHPLDFVLWKATKGGEDTVWASPWGKGRPGWHIECSVMAEEELGESFDVHAGGRDLLFPHHENEIAQSKGSGHGFARLWMHSGMLEKGGAKMAKSDGNIEKLSDVLDRVPSSTLLLVYYSALYRSPLAWSEAALEAAHAQGARITEALRWAHKSAGESAQGGHDTTELWESLHEALSDDFNLPIALAHVNNLVTELNAAREGRSANDERVAAITQTIEEFLHVFALDGLIPHEEPISPEAQELAVLRDQARALKDWGESDRLREAIHALGYVVRDTAAGTEIIVS